MDWGAKEEFSDGCKDGDRRINAKHIDLMLRVVVCSEENDCLFVIKAVAPFNSDKKDGNDAQLRLGSPVASYLALSTQKRIVERQFTF